MSDDNKSQTWTDPITGEVYPSINPHISIQKSTPLNSAVPQPDLQPQRDVMPPPRQTRPQFAPPPVPQTVRQSAPRAVQPVPRPVQPVPRSVQSDVTRFCEHCGGVINGAAAVCPFCGGKVEDIGQVGAVPLRQTDDPASGLKLFEPRIVINNNVVNNITQNVAPQTNGKRAVNKWVAFLLCFFFGLFGIHHFYEGRAGLGLLYLCTCGFFGIGVIVDLILILCKPNPYYV